MPVVVPVEDCQALQDIKLEETPQREGPDIIEDAVDQQGQG